MKSPLAWVSLLAFGCAKPACEGADRFLADDGNCYALDDGGEPVVDPDTIWLKDGGLAAGVQDRFRRNRGVAAADFDGDGDVDLFLGNPDDPATLLINDGTGVFTEQIGAPTTGLDTAVTAVDYDNDGDPDLMLTCGGWGGPCPPAMYRNDGVDEDSGEVVFTDVSEAAGLHPEGRHGFGMAWGDYDNDGFLDVFVSNKKDWSGGTTDSANQLYRNNGDGTFTEVGQDVGVGDTGDNHVATWLDVEPDGDLDLFVPALFSDNHLYVNQGDGTFLDETPEQLKVPYAAFGSTAEDLNNDGLVDLVVTATSDSGWAAEDPGEVTTVFLNQGSGDFSKHPTSSGLISGDDLRLPVMGFALGDINIDGYTDLFLGVGEPAGGRPNRLLLGTVAEDGGYQWEDASVLIQGEPEQDGGDEPYRPFPYRTHGSVIVDVDGDLDMDLFVGNGGMNLMPNQEEPNRLFLSSLSQVHGSIQVKLEGTHSNRDGVGALITVFSEEGPPVTRWVSRSSGFNSSLPAHHVIGLGDRVAPHRVQVQWPNGTVQTVDMEPDQRMLHLVETGG